MIKITPSELVLAVKKRPTHAPRDAVIVRCAFEMYLMSASSGHRGKTKRFGFRSIGLIVVFGSKTFQMVDVRSGLPGWNALESKLWVSAISFTLMEQDCHSTHFYYNLHLVFRYL